MHTTGHRGQVMHHLEAYIRVCVLHSWWHSLFRQIHHAGTCLNFFGWNYGSQAAVQECTIVLQLTPNSHGFWKSGRKAKWHVWKAKKTRNTIFNFIYIYLYIQLISHPFSWAGNLHINCNLNRGVTVHSCTIHVQGGIFFKKNISLHLCS